MGRLIDGDKLRKQMSEDYAQSVSKIGNPTVKAIVEKAVETFDGYVMRAETVEAIPVPWIESYALFAEADGRPFFAEGIRDMVEEWKRDRKKNEAD